MKQKIGVFVLSALLVLSLSACGQVSGRTGDNDILGDDYTTTERNYRQSTSPNNSLRGNNNGTDTRHGVLEPGNGSNNTANNNGTGTNGSTSNGKKSDSKSSNKSGANGGAKGSGNGSKSRNGMSEGILDTRGNSYEQMVRNGLVNDTDGDLTDGENSHS